MRGDCLNITLRNRELEHVKRFWHESKNPQLQELFPFQKNTLEEAIILYEDSLNQGATSYGKTIYVDDLYIGDIWCYCIDENIEKSCFISIVIFDKEFWGKGIGEKALLEFKGIVSRKFKINKLCAFTYKSNIASIKALEKTGFVSIEEFEENNISSIYLEYEIERKNIVK